jgi:hypothetical protein
MTTSPKTVRYYVQVARLRLDTAIVEVDASDDGDAEQKVIERARLLTGAEWELQPFDHAAYQPHAESMIAQGELTESEVVEDELRRNETRYLLLKGDCETGEGDIILQPWLKTQEPDLLASDLCAEWIGALEKLGLIHLSRLDDLAGGSLPTASDRILFGVARSAAPANGRSSVRPARITVRKIAFAARMDRARSFFRSAICVASIARTGT